MWKEGENKEKREGRNSAFSSAFIFGIHIFFYIGLVTPDWSVNIILTVICMNDTDSI